MQRSHEPPGHKFRSTSMQHTFCGPSLLLLLCLLVLSPYLLSLVPSLSHSLSPPPLCSFFFALSSSFPVPRLPFAHFSFFLLLLLLSKTLPEKHPQMAGKLDKYISACLRRRHRLVNLQRHVATHAGRYAGPFGWTFPKNPCAGGLSLSWHWPGMNECTTGCGACIKGTLLDK